MDEEKLRALADSIAQTVSAIDRTEHRLLGLLREFDARQGWAIDSATSFAAWLSWRTGMSPGAARERIRVATAIADLPLIDAALAAGEISYSKARAVTRVATAENEETLLASARGMTASELERLCQMLRRSEASAAGAAEPSRHFSQRMLEDGMIRLSFTVTVDEAAVVTAALDAAAETPNRRAEALVAIADERARGTSTGRNPIEVALRIEADDLSGMTAEGAAVPAEVARRLLCDAGVVPVLCDETGKTLDVGRKTRTIPTAIRRAMSLRDDGCCFPGCDHKLVDGHHLQHWIDGGETVLANLVSLCRVHHRLLHEGGATVAPHDDELVFRGRDGAVLIGAPSPAAAEPLPPERDAWLAVATDNLRPLDWHSIGGAFADL